MRLRIHSINELTSYQKYYSDNNLWSKISSAAKRIGYEMTYYLLVLYYTMLSPNVSIKNKAVICGALGYFILPADLMPDIIPILGFTDDLAAIKLAYDSIKVSVTPDIEVKARTKAGQWFPKA